MMIAALARVSVVAYLIVSALLDVAVAVAYCVD